MRIDFRTPVTPARVRPSRTSGREACRSSRSVCAGSDTVATDRFPVASMPENADFARLVSLAWHDLRTPLATVYGFARTLTRAGQLDETAARYVGMIEAASQQMGSLLDDLGLVARIEAGRYDPVPQQCDTVELARAAAERAGEKI